MRISLQVEPVFKYFNNNSCDALQPFHSGLVSEMDITRAVTAGKMESVPINVKHTENA